MALKELDNKNKAIEDGGEFKKKLVLFTTAFGLDIIGWMVGYDGYTMQIEQPLIIIDAGHGDIWKTFSSFGNFDRVFNFNVSHITSLVDANESLTAQYERGKAKVRNPTPPLFIVPGKPRTN